MLKTEHKPPHLWPYIPIYRICRAWWGKQHTEVRVHRGGFR
uniref:Uncharacterized protein n=1 Tax=Nonomuraea gerenzanensis TaxID=93944 RepID=A0A1M4EE92_9ACTN|nr:hypothetical protein BN4615_P6803 [Nonomuraea gerenzanensis]